MELVSDGAKAVLDAERAVVTQLEDILNGSYLEDDGLMVCFPFQNREASARLLFQQATARILFQRKDMFHVAFSSNADTKSVFAPSFQLMLAYAIAGAGLKVECTLNSLETEQAFPFYFGMDIRPRCPLFQWEKRSDYHLQTASGDTAQFANSRTGRGLEFTWDKLKFHPEKATATEGVCMTFEAAKQEPLTLAPMQSWRAQLCVEML